jgi:hypothetical protein
MAKPKSPWDHIRYGDAEKGLALLKEAYIRDPSASETMELGVAYLWVGSYQVAAEHFQRANQTHSHTMDVFYGMAGAAKWCLNDFSAAVELWHTGLGAQYADFAGGVHLPLLLWVTSVLKPKVFPRTKAENLLKQKVKDTRIKSWPGPIARFILGLIDEATMAAVCVERERETLDRKWLTQFYRGLIAFNQGNMRPGELKERMRRTADASLPEWSNEQNFLTLPWSEEFFIARHEAALDSAQQSVGVSQNGH